MFVCHHIRMHTLIGLNLTVTIGAQWDSEWRSDTGDSQLHLLLKAYPPPSADEAAYFRYVLGRVYSATYTYLHPYIA